MTTQKETSERQVFLLETKEEFWDWCRNSNDVMEAINTALMLDDHMRDLLEDETLLNETEKEVLKRWQSKLNH